MQILIQTTVYTQVKEQKLPQLYTSLSLTHTHTEPQIYNSHTHTQNTVVATNERDHNS